MRPCKAGLLLALFVAPVGAGAQSLLSDGFEESCLVDSDQDRLQNCVEAVQGLDYHDPDTDDDGLSDGDEVLGTLDGLDLPGFGVDPRRKDLLVEHDWQDDHVEPATCGPHSHKPSAATLQALAAAFAAMPVPNPDGSTGINLIQDVGQGGIFSGGNFVAVADATLVGGIGAEFAAYKAANFSPDRVGYFRYALNTHAHTATLGSSGVAEIVGDDFAVTLGCNWNQDLIRNTIMHELGHNLGLRHGGDTNCNRKPNYNSVMNYRYQFDGIDTDCKPGGDGVMDYSTGARAPLDETHLDETSGICGGVAINWNPVDGGVLTDTSQDINPYTNFSNPVFWQTQECGGLLTVLTDHDDFAALDLTGLPGAPGGGKPVPAEIVACGAVPSEEP